MGEPPRFVLAEAGPGDGTLISDALRAVIEPLHVPGVGIRIASEFDWITACSR